MMSTVGSPFLTDEDLDGVDVLIAEVQPSLYKAAPQPGEVKDQTLVRGAAEHFAKLDEAGGLSAAFAPPKTAAPELIADVEHQEGWTLGA